MAPVTRRKTVSIMFAGVLASAAKVSSAYAASASELAREGETALRHLYASQPRAKLLGSRAKAVLVFPRIVKVGVLLAGGQTGDGVLLVKGRPKAYFNLSAASFGPQAGGQTFSYALFFMTDGALEYLNRSDGWAIGTGPSVVVVDEGAAASLTSTTITQDVYAVPFAQKGLMAGIGLEGSKITHIKPDA